jgi:hypothetical protein
VSDQTPPTVPNPSTAPPALPPRPQRRACASRAATTCFWIVLIFFIAALGYIGLLAFSAGKGSFPGFSSLPNGHLLAGCILALCTIAAVVGSVATRNHRHHQHH